MKSYSKESTTLKRSLEDKDEKKQHVYESQTKIRKVPQADGTFAEETDIITKGREEVHTISSRKEEAMEQYKESYLHEIKEQFTLVLTSDEKFRNYEGNLVNEGQWLEWQKEKKPCLGLLYHELDVEEATTRILVDLRNFTVMMRGFNAAVDMKTIRHQGLVVLLAKKLKYIRESKYQTTIICTMYETAYDMLKGSDRKSFQPTEKEFAQNEKYAKIGYRGPDEIFANSQCEGFHDWNTFERFLNHLVGFEDDQFEMMTRFIVTAQLECRMFSHSDEAKYYRNVMFLGVSAMPKVHCDSNTAVIMGRNAPCPHRAVTVDRFGMCDNLYIGAEVKAGMYQVCAYFTMEVFGKLFVRGKHIKGSSGQTVDAVVNKFQLSPVFKQWWDKHLTPQGEDEGLFVGGERIPTHVANLPQFKNIRDMEQAKEDEEEAAAHRAFDDDARYTSCFLSCFFSSYCFSY